MLSDAPVSAPRIATMMGITRQGAQKQINLLVDDLAAARRALDLLAKRLEASGR